MMIAPASINCALFSLDLADVLGCNSYSVYDIRIATGTRTHEGKATSGCIHSETGVRCHIVLTPSIITASPRRLCKNSVL